VRTRILELWGYEGLAAGLYAQPQAVEQATDTPGRSGTAALRVKLRVPRSLLLEFALAQLKAIFG
jgi:hypothetical protein